MYHAFTKTSPWNNRRAVRMYLIDSGFPSAPKATLARDNPAGCPTMIDRDDFTFVRGTIDCRHASQTTEPGSAEPAARADNMVAGTVR